MGSSIKDQIDTQEDNKDIRMLKNELWKRRPITEVEIIMFRENQIVEEIILLKEIWKNNTREQKVQ